MDKTEYEALQKQIDELRENIENLEKEIDEGICGKPLILGACDINEVADAIKRKISVNDTEKKNGGNSDGNKRVTSTD